MANRITVNLDTNKNIYDIFECKQNDDLVLEAYIFENGIGKDISNATITINCTRADSTYVIQNTDITKEGNKIIANLKRDFTRVDGLDKLEIVLLENEKQNTTFDFNILVKPSVLKAAVEESKDTVIILEELGNKVEEARLAKAETENLISTGNAATKQDIATVNSQLEQKAKQWISVIDFGAKGDGVTSDSQAIQNAVNSGCNIIFPEGKTYLCKNIKLSNDKTLYMYGATLKCGGNSPIGKDSIENQQGIFYGYGTSTNYTKNITLMGGTLIGLRQPSDWNVQITYELGDDIMQFSFIDGLTVRDCSIQEAGQDGLEIKSCKNVLVQGNKFKNIADAGLEIRGTGSYIAKDNYFYMTRNALFMKGHEEFGHEIPKNVVFENNYCETHFSPIIFHHAENIAIRNNKLYPISTPDNSVIGSNQVAINTASPPTEGATNDIKNITITGNEIRGFVGALAIQIVVQKVGCVVEGISIKNNIIDNCKSGILVQGESTISNNSIKNLLCPTANDLAIVINNASGKNISISSNEIINCINGIAITNCDSCEISSNSFSGDMFLTGSGAIGLLNITDNVVSRSLNAINIIGLSGVKVESNTIKSTRLPISTEGDNNFIVNNKIIKTGGGAYYSIRIKGANNFVNNNKIEHDGTNPAIEYLTGSTGGNCSNNEVINTGAIATIRLYGNRIIIQSNKTKGGSQGIRIYGNECVINGNICETSVYQGLHIMSGASKNIVTSNICLNNGTNLGDEGTGTVLANNVVA